MKTQNYNVIKLEKSHLREMERVLGSAFADNPFAREFGGNAKYIGVVLGLLALLAMKERETTALGATDGDSLAGLAIVVRGDWGPSPRAIVLNFLRLVFRLPWSVFRSTLSWMKKLGEVMKDVEKRADERELLLLGVVPELHGKGIGRTLLERCYQITTEQGFQKMRVEVVGGTPAVAVYEKQGFVHEREFPYGERTIQVMRRQCNEKSA